MRNELNLRSYTYSELALRNGQEMEEMWIAYKGIIYDITNSRFWKNGRHYIDHWSGQDLTEELKLAPHSSKVLERFIVVGILEDYKKNI